MNEMDQLINNLKDFPAKVSLVDYRQRGFHLEVLLNAEQVRELARTLRDRRFYLSFVSAVHLLPAIEVLYQFASYTLPCRIMARAAVTEGDTMPTISDIFDGANWHERETRDMFGVVFTGHPYLEPLLLPEEDADRRPLLKAAEGLKTADKISPQPKKDAAEPPAEEEP
jgi:NADH-quinone oxidoreductase subunit C